MFHKIFCKFLQYLCFIVLSALGHTVELRTSNTQPASEFYIAVDFKIPDGSHVTAPIGVGKSMAPSIKLTNCKIMDTKYPKAEPILNFDGTISKYMGFYKDFTVVLKVSIEDITKPIDYDIFYVVCSRGCKPNQYKGQLQYNGKFTLPVEKTSVDKTIQKVDKCTETKLNESAPKVTTPVPIVVPKNAKQPEASYTKSHLSVPDTKSQNKTTIQNDLPIPNSLIYSIFAGLLGGLLLNVMPCVFPVISIKLLSVAKSAGQAPKLVRGQCFAYSVGTIFTFLALGLMLCLIRIKIPSVGWGFYMQHPQFNYVLLILFLLCALHFLEIYQFHFPIPQIRCLRTQKAGLCIKSFVNGIFGAITSAVCVGPFLGLPIGSALLSNSTIDAIVLFLAIGIGLASPFIFMMFFPQYISKFPKLSGRSLRIFSLILGTLMLISCTWLISVLSVQINNSLKLMWIMIILVLCSVLLYTIQSNAITKIVRSIIITAISIVGLSGYITVSPESFFSNTEAIEWHDFNGNLPDKRPLFLNFTANWCLNCQFNSRIFTNNDVINLFKNKHIYAVKCDWTNRDEEIAKLLSKFGSASVPLYVYYPKDGDPIILPTMLTKTNLISSIKECGGK